MNDFSDMLSKAKKVQDKMKEVQENLKKFEVEGASGGNLVKVVLSWRPRNEINFYQSGC
jgi:DNA-binding protein YbaB